MDRRRFLSATALGLMAPRLLEARTMWPAGAHEGFGAAGRLERIGLELYAVRKAMRENPEKTLEAVRAIGYADVELLWSFGNFGRTVPQVKAALKATGLKAPSAHMTPETILTEWERRLEEARELGHRYLVAPSLPSEANKSIDAIKVWAHRFNVAGEVARQAGIWLALHNEPNHEKPVMGQQPLEVFLAETDPKFVRFQLDVGNMLMGGGNPMAFLQKHQGRIGSFHIKNAAAGATRDTELSKGAFDLKALLATVRDLKDKPCFVEQEGGADELASARENYQYIRDLQW
ncbi:MAG: hypothetical protein RLZZ621_505 [Gemmatimonadota bacterium]